MILNPTHLSSLQTLKNPFRTKIGLALGGGGARGVAHIGVLKAMSESDYEIDCISGTSVGSLVATLYAFGLKWDQIQEIFSSLSLSRVGAFSMRSSGLMNGSRVADLVREHIGDADIRDAKIPLGIVCCDLKSGKNIVFTEGPAALLVQASGAFPGLFSPVYYQDMILVDGFLTENVPVSAVKKLGANFIVSVNLSTKSFELPEKISIKDAINRSFDILVDRPLNEVKMAASYAIDLDMSFVDRFKVSEVPGAIQLGYDETQIMLSKSLLYWFLYPIKSYLKGVVDSLWLLIVSLVDKPNIRWPKFYKLLKKRVFDFFSFKK